MIAKLLVAEPSVLGLMDPANLQLFHPIHSAASRLPTFIRANMYLYRFAAPGSDEARAGQWWTRELTAAYVPPLSLDNPSLKRFLEGHGWAVPAVPAPPEVAGVKGDDEQGARDGKKEL